MRIQVRKNIIRNIDLPISDQTGSLGKVVKNLKQKYIDAWWDSDPGFPGFLKTFSPDGKKELEKRLTPFADRICKRLEKQFNREGKPEETFLEPEFQPRYLIGQLSGVLGVSIPDRFADGFINSTHSFLEKIKWFDPGMALEDIYQALRNIWIMNSLQVYLNRQMHCSDSMFAYSLLYPYTDNIMDNSFQNVEKKIYWNHLLKNRLEGNSNPYQSEIERKIFHLLDLIETAFPRKKFPEVYQSLLLIYNAQNRSLVQQQPCDSPYIRDILGISFEKGGTSVLADGFLLQGKLDKKQQELCFGWGTFLQLSDDLQDVVIDRAKGHMTIFSQARENGQLDFLANKLFNYIHRILDSGFRDSRLRELKELSQCNFDLLLVEAIGKNCELFSPDYVRKMENFFPFGFSYLKKLQKKLRKSVLNKKKIIELDTILAGFLAVTSRLYES